MSDKATRAGGFIIALAGCAGCLGSTPDDGRALAPEPYIIPETFPVVEHDAKNDLGHLMNMALLFGMALAPLLAIGEPARAELRFAASTETVEELRDLYAAADDICRGALSQDVKVTVACVSRAIYGQALNEKGFCFGKNDQANAGMIWHRCTKTSLYFTPLDLPGM